MTKYKGFFLFEFTIGPTKVYVNMSRLSTTNIQTHVFFLMSTATSLVVYSFHPKMIVLLPIFFGPKMIVGLSASSEIEARSQIFLHQTFYIKKYFDNATIWSMVSMPYARPSLKHEQSFWDGGSTNIIQGFNKEHQVCIP